MPSPELGPRGGKYPNHIVQSILVPKDRTDVRGNVDRARVVAERYGARPRGKVVEQENFFAFRQVSPDRIQPGSYVSFKVPFSGVVLRKGVPIGARENPTHWWSKAPKAVREVYDSIAAHRDIGAQFAAARKFSRERLLETALWNDRDGDYHLNDRESLAGYVVNSVREASSVEYPPGHEYGARGNPPESSGSGVWWALGAAAVVLVITGAFTARGATSPNPNVTTPPPSPPPPPVPHPTPHPTTTYVVQPASFNPNSSAAVRIMQQQLTALGYTPGPIDGDFGQGTTIATLQFLTDHNLLFGASRRSTMIAIDTVYGEAFDASGRIVSI